MFAFDPDELVEVDNVKVSALSIHEVFAKLGGPAGMYAKAQAYLQRLCLCTARSVAS
jgi:hypothetical protein